MRKDERRLDGLDERIVSLCARGMRVCDIQGPFAGALWRGGLARPD
jgi:hypothetical protein